MLEKSGVYFIFEIENKKIIGILKGYHLPYQPPNISEVKKQILFSRNKLPAWLENFFIITPQEQAEFDNAKDEESLKEIILKDAKKENCKVIDIKYRWNR